MEFPAADEAQHAASPANSATSVDKEKHTALLIWNRRPNPFSKRRLVILFACLGSLIAIALAVGLGLGLGLHHTPKSTPVSPIVNLGYAQYQGSNSNGVAQWLGMRYAAAPTGKLRFAAPAPPPPRQGVQSATQVCTIIQEFTFIADTGASTAINASASIPTTPRPHLRQVIATVKTVFSSKCTRLEMPQPSRDSQSTSIFKGVDSCRMTVHITRHP